MAERTYAKGLYAKAPHPNAPDFVRGKLSFKVSDFIQFLKDNENDKGYVNVDLLNSREEGKWNAVLDTYQGGQRASTREDF